MINKFWILLSAILALLACQSEEQYYHEKYKPVYVFLSTDEVYEKFVGFNLRQLEDSTKFHIISKFIENFRDTLQYQDGALKIKDENKIYYTFNMQNRIKELIEIMTDYHIRVAYTHYHDEATDKLNPVEQSEKYWLVFSFGDKYQLNYLNLKKERVTDGVLIYSWYDDNWALGANIFHGYNQ